MMKRGRSLRYVIPILSLLFCLPGQHPAGCGVPVKQVSLPKIQSICFLNAINSVDSQGNVNSILIPLKRAGRLLLIEAEIDGTVGNFVFDTGADKLVLNKTYFRKNLQSVEESGGGLTGGARTVYKTHVDRLMASELIFENITADVTDLGQIENRRKVKILGLFGIGLFTGYEMEIDARNSSLLLTRLDKKGNPVDPEFQQKECHFRGMLNSHSQVLIIRGIIGGKSMDFCLDTGAETNVISNSAPKKALETISISNRSELTGVGGQDAEVLLGTMNDFAIGNIKFRPMQTIVASLTSLSQAYDYPISGILGFDFFDQGVICINLVTKEFRVTLNERGVL
ncbi:MAG: retropepsin-like aspartic protease [Bacteroidota bacterium]